MSKVTDLDRSIGSRVREFRIASKLTQLQVASHLGITYQSYQRLETGKRSFRVSILDNLAALYDKKLFDFIDGAKLETDPLAIKAGLLLHGMTDKGREDAIRAILNIKHGGDK